jgi:phage shock protein C
MDDHRENEPEKIEQGVPEIEGASREERTSSEKQLYRSETNKIVAGVCGGLGEYFDVDPTVIRLAFVILSFVGASGFVLYMILWLVIPRRSDLRVGDRDTIRSSVEEMKSTARTFTSSLGGPRSHSDNSNFIAMLFVILGVIFLLKNFHLFDIFDVGRLWPLVLVVVGIMLLVKRK